MEAPKYAAAKPKHRLKLFSAVLIILLAIGLYLFYSASQPKFYEGEIYKEPSSERSKEYLAFRLIEKEQNPGFMILVKDLGFYSRIESFMNKRVEVKAFLHFHEPEDFNKIEIVAIKEKQP